MNWPELLETFMKHVEIFKKTPELTAFVFR
jgi:hypothetical protein